MRYADRSTNFRNMENTASDTPAVPTLQGLFFDWDDKLCEVLGHLPTAPKYYLVRATDEDGVSIQLFRLSMLLDYTLFPSLSALKKAIGIDEEEEKREIENNLRAAGERMDAAGRAFNSAEHVAKRREIMQPPSEPQERRGFWARLLSQ